MNDNIDIINLGMIIFKIMTLLFFLLLHIINI